MKRWSSLQREIYKIIDDSIPLQIHLSRYRMNSQYGSTDLPRYWITFGNEIIFDYPKQFVFQDETGCFVKNLLGEKLYYPYETDISYISELIREYLDTPKDEVFTTLELYEPKDESQTGFGLIGKCDWEERWGIEAVILDNKLIYFGGVDMISP